MLGFSSSQQNRLQHQIRIATELEKNNCFMKEKISQPKHFSRRVSWVCSVYTVLLMLISFVVHTVHCLNI